MFLGGLKESERGVQPDSGTFDPRMKVLTPEDLCGHVCTHLSHRVKATLGKLTS